MSFVESLGTLMVKSAIQILGFIFPVCIGKVTQGLADRVFVYLWTVMVSVFPSGDGALAELLEGLWAKWAMWCSAQLLGHVVKLHSFDITPHLFWPRLAVCALAQISRLFTYTPSKQAWKADTAPFEVLKNFAIHLQDQRHCIFQASCSEVHTGLVCSYFFTEKSSAPSCPSSAVRAERLQTVLVF